MSSATRRTCVYVVAASPWHTQPGVGDNTHWIAQMGEVVIPLLWRDQIAKKSFELLMKGLDTEGMAYHTGIYLGKTVGDKSVSHMLTA